MELFKKKKKKKKKAESLENPRPKTSRNTLKCRKKADLDLAQNHEKKSHKNKNFQLSKVGKHLYPGMFQLASPPLT